MTKALVYRIFLILMTLLIWLHLYTARFDEYDDNIAKVILAFFESLFGFIAVFIIWLKWRATTKEARWQTAAFLLLNSPLTIGIVILNYSTVFGVILKS